MQAALGIRAALTRDKSCGIETVRDCARWGMADVQMESVSKGSATDFQGFLRRLKVAYKGPAKCPVAVFMLKNALRAAT